MPAVTRRIPWGVVPSWAVVRPDKFARVVGLGDLCRHYGTKEWGVVESIELRRDGSAELILSNLETKSTHFWGTYHVDYWGEHRKIPDGLL